MTDDLWDIVRGVKEASGYDREAYEHELENERTKPQRSAGQVGPSVSEASSKSTYILKLEGPFDTPAKVQEAAALTETPAITTGSGQLGDASFVTIDTTAKDAITSWLSRHGTKGFAPTIVKVSKSAKDLSAHSMCPTLGIETTLPQHRPQTSGAEFTPAPDQYPVWYFVYGNLAVPEILTRRLSLSEPPKFTPATVKGGVIRRWRNKDNALIDDGSSAYTSGWAYLLQTEEHEEALRLYETENYEIVRCLITMEGKEVWGLTFKFVGPTRGSDLRARLLPILTTATYSIEQWISEELTAMTRSHDSSLTVFKLARRTILISSFLRPVVASSTLLVVI